MNSNEVRRQWAEQTGEYSPEYYAYYGPDETSERIRSLLESYCDDDAAVLELGCSAGRHLAHLHDSGFESLAGIEVNADARDVLEENYPDLADAGTFYFDAIEDVVGEFDDGAFDAVYSVETLQHLHPDSDWVFDEIARITSNVLVTVENEGGESGDSDSEEGFVNDSSGDENSGRDDENIDSDDASVRDVNYVHDEFPLYYRDWNDVFTDLGFREVETRSTKRDTIRVFRASGN